MEKIIFSSKNSEVKYFAENHRCLSGGIVVPNNFFDKPRTLTDCLVRRGLQKTLWLISEAPSVFEGKWHAYYACGKEIKELGESLGRDFSYWYNHPGNLALALLEEYDRLPDGRTVSGAIESILTKHFQ